MTEFERFIKFYGEMEFLRITEIVAPESQEVFIRRLYEEIDAIIRTIESGKKERQNDGEDRLSFEIVACLKAAGYLSQKDPTQGGHVDILVEPKQKREFKWYGEAKIWNGVDYLGGGMNQLLDRYASGREPYLGFLVYFKERDLKLKMQKWRERLTTMDGIDNSAFEVISDFSFSTKHYHATGSTIKVRHFSLNIFWNPT